MDCYLNILHYFAEAGDTAGVQAELARGVPVDARDREGNSSFFLVVKSTRSSMQLLQFLLDRGADVNTRDDRNHSPLSWAAKTASIPVDLLQFLIRAGADVNAGVEIAKNYEKRIQEYEEKIIAHGPKGLKPDNEEHTFYAKLLEYEVNNLAFFQGWKDFPLGLAAVTGDLNKVRCLLSAGADVQALSPKGQSPLTHTLKGLNGNTLFPMVQLLVDHGSPLDPAHPDAECPLLIASHLGHYDVVRLLLDRGANPDPLKWTPLLWAVFHQDLPALSACLEKEGINQTKDFWGRNPFLLAAHMGNTVTAGWLAARGADLETTDSDGNNGLHLAAAAGQNAMVEWLLARHFRTDPLNADGKSVLYMAARRPSVCCTRALLQAGAQLHDGPENPCRLLFHCQDLEVCKTLAEFGFDPSEASLPMKRKWMGLPENYKPTCTLEQAESHRLCTFGQTNPQVMDNPYWQDVVLTGWPIPSFQFGLILQGGRSQWTFCRNRMSFTPLPDGRCVNIGGVFGYSFEIIHWVYNDIVVTSPDGSIRILGYPPEVFPPVYGHTATYYRGKIYILGGKNRVDEPGSPTIRVFALDCDTWRMEKITPWGQGPPGFCNHRAFLGPSGVLKLSEGFIVGKEGEFEETVQPNTKTWHLDLGTLTWVGDANSESLNSGAGFKR